MKQDPLKDLPRLSDEAMGPCAMCKRQLLETELPLFYRITAARCGIDGNEVRRHVGLAQAIAPGADGLALAGVLGPGVKPVVVMNDAGTFNVCQRCAQKNPLELLVIAVAEMKEDSDSGGGK